MGATPVHKNARNVPRAYFYAYCMPGILFLERQCTVKRSLNHVKLGNAAQRICRTITARVKELLRTHQLRPSALETDSRRCSGAAKLLPHLQERY